MEDKKYSSVLSYVDHIKEKMEFKNGCRINEARKTAIVYHPVLVAFLHDKKWPIRDTKKNTINGWNYRGSYISGFIEGQEYFKQTYGSGDPYNEKFIADLFVMYNNLGHDNYEGWNFVKHSYPVYFSHEIIKDWGYYGGIVFEFENLLKKHPAMELKLLKVKNTEPLRDTLEKALNNNKKKIEIIKDWFIKNNLCDPETFTYKDQGKGNMAMLACVLKNLNVKGYTENKLSDTEIWHIAKNSFHFEISLSTINHTKTDTYTIRLSPFLPE